MSQSSVDAVPSIEEVPAAEEYRGTHLPARLPARDVAWGAEPGDVSSSVSLVAIFKAIDRLEDVVDIETAALKDGKALPLEEFNYRKSHGLLELTRAIRGIDINLIDLSLRTRLTDLRSGLERNLLMLKTHLDAAREISSILTTAIREAESDGTYSAPAGLKGKVR